MPIVYEYKPSWYKGVDETVFVAPEVDNKFVQDMVIDRIGLEGKYPEDNRATPSQIRYAFNMDRWPLSYTKDMVSVYYTFKVLFSFDDNKHFNLFKIMYPEDAKRLTLKGDSDG